MSIRTSWVKPRVWGAVLSICFLMAPVLAGAESSTQVPVQVEMVETGSLHVSWQATQHTFMLEGAAPTLTAANPTVTATAEFVLIVTDTRSDATRSGYLIQIQADRFLGEIWRDSIDPASLWISDVRGSLGGFVRGLTLDQPVTVFSTNGATPVDTSITIVVAMELTPEMSADLYTGGISFTLQPFAP